MHCGLALPKKLHLPLISTDDTDQISSSRCLALLTDLISYQCYQW